MRNLLKQVVALRQKSWDNHDAPAKMGVYINDAAVAPAVERILGKDEVVGSNPACSTI